MSGRRWQIGIAAVALVSGCARQELLQAAPEPAVGAETGRQVFMAKCWGCHHMTQEAFGPSFQSIAARRSDQLIRAMLADPPAVSRALGYERNAMPRIPLNEDETRGIVALMRELRRSAGGP